MCIRDRDTQLPAEIERTFHKTVKKVTEDIEAMRFHTALSALMVFVNEAQGAGPLPRWLIEGFVLLLSPFAPHLGEELWEHLGHDNTLAYEPWPSMMASLNNKKMFRGSLEPQWFLFLGPL